MRGEAIQMIGLMRAGSFADLDRPPALEAARHALSLADGIIYATAMKIGATLWTEGEHFSKLPNVCFYST